MSPELWTQLAALGVAFCGVVVAGLSPMMTFRFVKTSEYRQALYSKQLEACGEVVNALGDWHFKAQEYIVCCACRLNTKTRNGLRENTYDESRYFHNIYKKCALVLPRDITDALSYFIKVMNGISAPTTAAHQYPAELVYSNDPGMDLSKAYQNVITVMRHHLCIEPLTQESLELIGKQSPECVKIEERQE